MQWGKYDTTTLCTHYIHILDSWRGNSLSHIFTYDVPYFTDQNILHKKAAEIERIADGKYCHITLIFHAYQTGVSVTFTHDGNFILN
jgi:hypothetical protein